MKGRKIDGSSFGTLNQSTGIIRTIWYIDVKGCYWASCTSLWVICPLIFLPIRSRFPLMLPYQTPCICWFERWYDNYPNEAYLTIVLDIPECNRRASERPVPRPWWLRLGRAKSERLSRELITTCSDIFDLIGLHVQMCTQTHLKAWITKRKSRDTSQTQERWPTTW